MAESSPNSLNPMHLLPPPTLHPCPTCSCSHSHSQFHFQQPPVSSENRTARESEDSRTRSPGTSISVPNPDHALNFPPPKLQEGLSLSVPRFLDVFEFPQPQLPVSAPAPKPVSTAAPAVDSAQSPSVQSHGNAADLPSSSSLNPNSLLESFKYKNRLQEYAQRSSIPLPEYRTVNEGLTHAPRFRSSVEVDGVTYTSPNCFLHRKSAEQDVAKLALELILKSIKDEGSPIIHADTVFCKSILNEFAVKLNMPTLTYTTVKTEAMIPVFVSSLVFNGKTYTGEPGKSKKEAEQLAARAAILSLMAESGLGTALFEIIKSKGKLFDALYKVKHLNYSHESIASVGGNAETGSTIPHTQSQVSEAYVPAVSQLISVAQEASLPVVSQPFGAYPNVHTIMHPPRHEFRMPKQETSSGATNPLAESVLPIQQRFISFIPPTQPLGVVPIVGKRRNRKNKAKAKAKKRVRGCA